MCPSASATVGKSISWRFEGGREGCGETTVAVGVSGALLECKFGPESESMAKGLWK